MYTSFLNATATTEIYTLSLHDALPISEEPGAAQHDLARVEHADLHALHRRPDGVGFHLAVGLHADHDRGLGRADRKSTRLNSSHVEISYAVFCLKKKITEPH